MKKMCFTNDVPQLYYNDDIIGINVKDGLINIDVRNPDSDKNVWLVICKMSVDSVWKRKRDAYKRLYEVMDKYGGPLNVYVEKREIE